MGWLQAGFSSCGGSVHLKRDKWGDECTPSGERHMLLSVQFQVKFCMVLSELASSWLRNLRWFEFEQHFVPYLEILPLLVVLSFFLAYQHQKRDICVGLWSLWVPFSSVYFVICIGKCCVPGDQGSHVGWKICFNLTCSDLAGGLALLFKLPPSSKEGGWKWYG